MPGSPVEGSRENSTPVPLSSPMLPNTIACTLTAVPMLSSILLILRYSIARGFIQLSNTALMAIRSCSLASLTGKTKPLFCLERLQITLRRPPSGWRQVRVLLGPELLLLAASWKSNTSMSTP